jgi:hypothetical protein
VGRGQMRGRGGLQRVPGVLYWRMASVYGGWPRTRLGAVGGVWERRFELVPGNTQVVSVDGGSTQNHVGFSG